ncbi:MAG: type II toxin-antitoxin system HicA family toxin [Candidatus Binataceae bacterium]
MSRGARLPVRFASSDWQTGSHLILRNTAPPYRRIVVPSHDEIATGTLHAIIRQTGLSTEQFSSRLQVKSRQLKTNPCETSCGNSTHRRNACASG